MAISKHFKDLALGATFHLGKSKGMGQMKDVEMWQVLRKDSPSTATIIEQHGFGNTRAVGASRPLAPNTTIYPVAPVGHSTL